MPEITYDVDLTAFGYGGEAIGRLPDGRAIFVAYALPGERVRVILTEEKRGFARGRLVEILRSAPERIAPRCPHFTICGGCQLQHLPYEYQLTVKTNTVREQLQRIAGLPNPPVEPILPAPQAWNYRNAVQFHLTPEGKPGFQAASSNRVVNIRECHLPEPLINTIWPQFEFDGAEGIDRVSIRLGAGDNAMLVLESDEIDLPEMDLDIPISVVHLSPAGPMVMAGDEALIMEVKGRAFQVSAPSFFQVNTAQAAAMVDFVLKHLPTGPKVTLLELYAGVGLFSAFLAGQVERLVAVEVSPSACDDYAINLDEFENVELYVGSAEEILPGLKLQPDAVLVDPPRSGLDKTALDALVQMKPGCIVYVSCDPSTLARDAKRLLAAGYNLRVTQPVDMFPQTYHIESISVFEL